MADVWPQCPAIDEALVTGSVDELLAPLPRASTERVGAAHGLSAAEEWRIVTFGGMPALFDRFAFDRVDIDR